jgi:lysophospholipase L1-like esterase
MDEREHRREQLSDRQPIGGRPNVHDPSHPGIGDPVDRRLTMPAGRVFLVVLVALLIAALLNSEAIVRAGEGMRPGTTRDVVLSLGRPLDSVAGFVRLHLPRKGFDMAFGQESRTGSGTELEAGSAAILERRAKRRAKPVWRQPTADRPLDVLVTGDSEAELVGLRMADLDTDDLLEVETVPRNGTALTNPGFFNWELNAEQEMASRDPDAVVMLIGANDGFNVDVGGELFGPGTPAWETEFARRVAVVMKALGGDGERPVYWVPPPTARDETYNEIYRSQNRAVERAAESVEGARHVDVFTTINDGEYSDQVEVDGRRIFGRQSDGIHFNREGAEIPARLVLEAMAEDYPALEGGIPAQERLNGRRRLGGG